MHFTKRVVYISLEYGKHLAEVRLTKTVDIEVFRINLLKLEPKNLERVDGGL